MKFLTSNIGLLIIFATLTSGTTTNNISNRYVSGELEPGWYDALIVYSMHSTGYNETTYTGQVLVQYDKVIDINIGGVSPVHSGTNYIYSGGALTFEKENRTITSATALLCIATPEGNAYFQITLE